MKEKVLTAAIIWMFILFIGAAAYKYLYVPATKKAAETVAKNEKINTVLNTSADSHYKYNLNVGNDSFSGYSILRSPKFIEETSSRSIKINFVDDGADYPKRLKSLQSGDTQMATFTIDALIKTSSEINDIPAVLVSFIDETKGADAMVGYKTAIPNIDALNNKNIKFVLVPNSPSETLVRVLLAHFNLRNVDVNNCWEFAQDAADVYDRYRKSKPTDLKVFVLWQPYVSRVLENPNTHVIIDSSKFKGFISDVLVVSRDFLVKNEDVVKEVVESYLRSVYAYRDSMPKLVIEDANKLGQPLKEDQAKNLVDGIWWKNTQENFAHMGFGDKKLQHVEDIVINITDVLTKTKAISEDPSKGKPNYFYYDKILKSLFDTGFHPGVGETVRKEEKLSQLTDAQWDTLIPVGTLSAKELVFARGTAILTETSRQTLIELCQKLNNWSQYYLVVEGNAASRGNPVANKELAKKRAQIVADFIITQGIDRNRVKYKATDPKNASTVSFVLGQLPY